MSSCNKVENDNLGRWPCDNLGDDIYVFIGKNKYGIAKREDMLLSAEYDYIIYHSMQSSGKNSSYWFQLCQNNKSGLCEIAVDATTGKSVINMITDCEFYAMYMLDDHWRFNIFVFMNKEGLRYYNTVTGKFSSNYRFIYGDAFSDYLRVYDGKMHFLINRLTDEVIYKKDTGDNYWGICNIGSDNFFDLSSKQLLIKDGNNWSIQTGYTAVSPVIIYPFPHQKHKNIANVVRKATGIGAVDSQGKTLIEPEYDEISYELKITATKDGKKSKVHIPLGNHSKYDKKS